MNRLLLLSCCMIGCFLQCLAQTRQPSYAILQQLLKEERPDTADLRVLLDAGYSYVMRPGSGRADMDSATLYAEKVLISAVKTGNKLWEGRSSLLYSKILREQQINDKGKVYALKAKEIFEKNNAKEYLADTYTELADYYSAQPRESIDQRIAYFKEAIKLYTEIGKKEELAHTLYVLGDCYNVIREYKLMTDVLARSVALYDEIKVEPGADIYSLLGLGYNRSGDYGNSLKYNLLAVKVIESLHDTVSAHITVYNRLGLLYYFMGEQPEALKFYQKAWPIALKLKDTANMQFVSLNMVASYVKMGMFKEAMVLLKQEERNYPPADEMNKMWLYIFFGGCYLDLGQPAAAASYLHKLNEKRDLAPEALQAAIDDLGARYTFHTGQYARSHELAMKALTASINVNSNGAQLSAYHALFRADSAMGNFKEALEHFRMYKNINDTLFNIAKARKISALQVQFETRQKDQALQLKEQSIELLTRRGQLQTIALAKARFTRNVIIAGAAMLVLMLALGYNRYQLKLRSNRQMKQKQDEINQKNLSLQNLITGQNKLLGEKEWLVKEIHHRVKNNLQIVMSLLNTQAAFLDDKDALNAIRESRYRMQAISLIHQKLYQSENMALIDMNTYIHDLVEYLKDGFTGIGNIRFNLQIAAVKLDVSQSVPIGLILNEAITNAIKYAFKEQGIILVSLLETTPGRLTLTIADNGAGLPLTAGDQKLKPSMGMMLMNTLAEQLEGTLKIESRNGVTITVNFKYQEKQAFTQQEEMAEEVIC